MFAAINRGDGKSLFAPMTDDVSWTLIGTTKFSGTYRGKGEIAEKFLRRVMSEVNGEISHTLQNIAAENDTVVVQSQGVSATNSGKPYNNTYCLVFRFAGDKVREITEYCDTELITTAFGK